MNIPTQSLTRTHTLAHTHIFDRRTCCLVAHAHSGCEQMHAQAQACTRLQPHCLISLRGLSTASREEAQEAEHWRRNGSLKRQDKTLAF